LNPVSSTPSNQAASKNVADAVKLAYALVKQGNSAETIRAIHERLQSNQPIAQANDLLAVLIRSYAARSLTPDEYRTRESESLHAISRTQPSLKPAVDQIETAYSGEFPTFFRQTEAEQLFRDWTKSKLLRSSFGALLQSLGDYYCLRPEEGKSRDQKEKTLRYYACAWFQRCRSPSPRRAATGANHARTLGKML
jgi:hypothetical protein